MGRVNSKAITKAQKFMMEFQKQVALLAVNNDEDKKHHQYTLDETLQAVLELDDEIDSQIYQGLV